MSQNLEIPSRAILFIALVVVLNLRSGDCYEGEASGSLQPSKCYQCAYSEGYGYLKPIDPSIKTGIQCKYGGSLGGDFTEDCTQLSSRSGDEFVCGTIKGELKGSKFYLRGCHPKSKVKLSGNEEFPGPGSCASESISKRWEYMQAIYGRGVGPTPPKDSNNIITSCFCDDKDFCNGAHNPRISTLLILLTVILTCLALFPSIQPF